MTIQSMTGFGRSEAAGEHFEVTVEIKSVNHRFKDIRCKMSNRLSPIEVKMRKLVESKFSRGSFDIYVNYKKATQNNKADDLDHGKIKNYLATVKQLGIESEIAITLNATDLLRAEFYKDQDDTDLEELNELVLKALNSALDDLLVARETEGKKMSAVILKHRQDYEEKFLSIPPLADNYRENLSDRIRKRLTEFEGISDGNEGRFLQEVVYYLEKLDVEEEISRIKSHLTKFDKLLKGNNEVGRQLDFLLQELNRETNTIGSKSGHEDISNAVVQMKMQLEKIREQALNLQ